MWAKKKKKKCKWVIAAAAEARSKNDLRREKKTENGFALPNEKGVKWVDGYESIHEGSEEIQIILFLG